MQAASGPKSRFIEALASPYWREADARAVLEEWRASGLSVSGFAREHSLNRPRLQRWKRRLMSEFDERPEPSPLFIPLEVVAASRERAVEVDAWRIELSGGVSISVPVEGGAELLAEALAAVRMGWAC